MIGSLVLYTKDGKNKRMSPKQMALLVYIGKSATPIRLTHIKSELCCERIWQALQVESFTATRVIAGTPNALEVALTGKGLQAYNNIISTPALLKSCEGLIFVVCDAVQELKPYAPLAIIATIEAMVYHEWLRLIQAREGSLYKFASYLGSSHRILEKCLHAKARGDGHMNAVAKEYYVKLIGGVK